MWDISFGSTVHAERLRFTDEPGTSVRFPGTGTRESTSHTDRTHLPDTVTAGQEYRDVTVAYRLATRCTGEPGDGRSGDTGADG
ncbi:hypothetical protein HTV45_00465 [Streptomyces sp. CHD11]|uniref:hypothetical protein n=1 Tax=Streptomyces sp. CHD11 TaxID=2741325 RepID=UPI001BFCA210|nr:hypothetical protein [Streptomyces sp. CHD11]MBT3149397.1 hypothetical protein [Streptomyces sp. CHD11]